MRVVRRCERDWHRLTGKASERGRESVNGSQPRPSLPLALAAPASGMEHQCCSLSLFHAFNFHFVTVAGGMDEGPTVQQIHSLMLALDPLSTLSNPTQARRERGREGERGPLSLRCFSGEGRREGGPEMWNKRPSDRPTAYRTCSPPVPHSRPLHFQYVFLLACLVRYVQTSVRVGMSTVWVARPKSEHHSSIIKKVM